MDSHSETPDKLMTVEMLADKLNVESYTVRKWCRLDKIPRIKLGKEYRFEPAAIDRWLAGLTFGPSRGGRS